MKARVEQLALRYRLPVGAPRVHARLPSIERALRARLADEIAAQLAAIDEGGDEVIVVREATAQVTLRIGEHARDDAAVARVSDAARDAVVALLARSADEEQVHRFPSDAAYVGSFVVELLDGTAWDRWYFDGFSRFRRADPGATIIALLADADTECMALFAWLEQRGRLADVLRLVGPSAARSLASALPATQPDSVPPADLAPLALAAFEITATLGLSIESARHPELLAEYHRHESARPAWTDRRALTEWTWRFTHWLLSRDASHVIAATSSASPPSALASLLAEQLDWLDGETILARVAARSAGAPEQRVMQAAEIAGRALAPRHAAQLRMIADALHSGSLRLGLRAEPRDQLLVRMLAALQIADPAAPARPDEALVAALEQVLDAALRLDTTASDVPLRPTDPGTPASPVVRTPGPDGVAPERTHAPEVIALVRALTMRESVAGGVRSSHAGLYLLARPIADLRLDRLAERAGVPFAALLAAVAMKMLGVTRPFDEALLPWLGAPDAEIGGLEEHALHTLQLLVLRTLADQRQLPGDAAAVAGFDWRGESFVAVAEKTGTCWPLVARQSDGGAGAPLLAAWRRATGGEPELTEPARSPTADLDALPATPALSPMVEIQVASLATCVLRSLSGWLPGLAASSTPFLVRNCIARGGVVSTTRDGISVVLDRAPLDVVLEMAGCFSPLTSASWLGRSVHFSFARTER